MTFILEKSIIFTPYNCIWQLDLIGNIKKDIWLLYKIMTNQ